MNAVLRMLSTKRRRQSEPRMVEIRPGHRPEPAYVRIGRHISQFFTAERADYLIGVGCVVGVVVAFGWTLHDWLVLRGWL